MRKKPLEYRIRQVSVIIMFITGILTVLSGILLFGMPEGPGSGESVALGISKDGWILIHEWAGFIASGMLVIHLYLNRRPLIRYFKEFF